jgi:hypothetical protein
MRPNLYIQSCRGNGFGFDGKPRKKKNRPEGAVSGSFYILIIGLALAGFFH